VTLPFIGTIRVHNDTRSLRRLTRAGAKIIYATLSYGAGHWWLALNVEAPDLHPGRRHSQQRSAGDVGWVGVDLGLKSFLVAATVDGIEVARVDKAPKPLSAAIRRQRFLAKSLSRKKIGSNNRRKAAAKLARNHNRIRNIRKHFHHQVANELVKTHDRLVLEDLNVVGMRANRRLARAIADAGWADFGRLLRYKQAWRHGLVATADRWFPSTKICSKCGVVNHGIALRDRMFICRNGHTLDRDRNAATNLARWAKKNIDLNSPRTVKQPAGSTTPADGTALADTPCVSVKPIRMKREPTFSLRVQP
jgi:putative transposase